MNLESQDQRTLLLRDGDKDEYGWEIRKGTSGDKVSNSSKKRHIGRRHQLQHTAAKKEKKKIGTRPLNLFWQSLTTQFTEWLHNT